MGLFDRRPGTAGDAAARSDSAAHHDDIGHAASVDGDVSCRGGDFHGHLANQRPQFFLVGALSEGANEGAQAPCTTLLVSQADAEAISNFGGNPQNR